MVSKKRFHFITQPFYTRKLWPSTSDISYIDALDPAPELIAPKWIKLIKSATNGPDLSSPED